MHTSIQMKAVAIVLKIRKSKGEACVKFATAAKRFGYTGFHSVQSPRRIHRMILTPLVSTGAVLRVRDLRKFVWKI